MKPRNVALIGGVFVALGVLGWVVAWSHFFRRPLPPDFDIVLVEDSAFHQGGDPYQSVSRPRPENLEGPLAPADLQAICGRVAKAADYALSGPCTHANL